MNRLPKSDTDLPHDHVAGRRDAKVAIVEYGDYGCVQCDRLHDVLRRVLDQDGVPVRYVFRHLPVVSPEHEGLARAIASEAAERQGKFWEMHDALFRCAAEADGDIIETAARDAGVDLARFHRDRDDPSIRAEVQEDIESALAHGIHRVPTLFIRGKEYSGAWDVESIQEAVKPPVAARVKDLALDFTNWAAASGAVLIVFSIIALIWRNSPFGRFYEVFWGIEAGVVANGHSLVMPLHDWVNDLLMAVFFLVVGLELKRELVAGQLSRWDRAMFPAAAAIGGMLFPALIYLALNRGSSSAVGWGIPMATDIAFMLGVLTLLGNRVPRSMIVFASALAIVDDLGAIVVLAVFFSHELNFGAIGAVVLLVTILCGFNRARVYALWPYLGVGVLLWLAVHRSGLHATLAGVLVAATIPLRKSASLQTLLAQESIEVQQATSAVDSGGGHEAEELERLTERVHMIDRRLHPPAERLAHELQPWSSYWVLPVFAMANAGVVLSLGGNSSARPESLGIIMGLVIGKPLGILLATALVHRIGLGKKPRDATWSHIFGVGCLCGIGFTMSIFIATEAFVTGEKLAAAKLSVMIASTVAAAVGIGWLILIDRRHDLAGRAVR